MNRQPSRPRLTIGGKRRLIQKCGEETAEAITDWVAIVMKELSASEEIPILALALADLFRRYAQAEKRGLNGQSQIVKKHLADCASAILKVEDRSAITRPKASNKKHKKEQKMGNDKRL
jgi:hypothetical protein